MTDPLNRAWVNYMIRHAHRPKPRGKRLTVFQRDGWRCVYCNCHLTKKNATLDHVIPESRGGSDHEDNLVASCGPCNWRKGNLTLDEWIDQDPSWVKVPA